MATAIDPVCQMEVDTQKPPGGSYEHEGVTYFFCSPGCLEDFKDNPARFVNL
jgi:P-type Cu+ transporter